MLFDDCHVNKCWLEHNIITLASISTLMCSSSLSSNENSFFMSVLDLVNTSAWLPFFLMRFLRRPESTCIRDTLPCRQRDSASLTEISWKVKVKALTGL